MLNCILAVVFFGVGIMYTVVGSVGILQDDTDFAAFVLFVSAFNYAFSGYFCWETVKEAKK